jgi:hypothetical protein
MPEIDFDRGADDRLVRRLRTLAEGPAPPERVEERVVAELRARGLLEPRRAWRRLLAAAAAVVLFAGGWLAGRAPVDLSSAPHPPAGFALFLLGGVEPGADEAELVEEYRAWAVGLAREGQLSAGEKLGPSAWLLDGASGETVLRTAPEAVRAAPLSGFFLLTTGDPEEALAIARSCPHLRHGGEVLLRPIEQT